MAFLPERLVSATEHSRKGQLSTALAENPGGHRAVVLDDGSLERVDKDGVQLVGQGEEFGFVDQEPLGTVGQEEDSRAQLGEGHADAGAEAAEEQTSGAKDSPELREHDAEVPAIAGEVQDGVAEDDFRQGVWERHVLDIGDLQILRGQIDAERGRRVRGRALRLRG